MPSCPILLSGETTRASLQKTVTTLFSDQGFEGVSVHDTENVANVHRGLLTYHFESKEALWKQVVDTVFTIIKGVLDQRREILQDMASRARFDLI